MAIVKMKRISLLAMRADEKKLLKRLQAMGCVEVSPISEEELRAYQTHDEARIMQVNETLTRLNWLISQSSRYVKQPSPFMGNKPDAADADVAYVTDHEMELQAALDRAEALEKENGECRGTLVRLTVARNQLLPWQALEIPVEKLAPTRHVTQLLGSLPSRCWEELLERWKELPVMITVLPPAGEAEQTPRTVETLEDIPEYARGRKGNVQVAVWLCVHRDALAQVQEDLKAFGFSPAQLGEQTGTIQEQLRALDQQMADVRARQAKIEEEREALAQQQTHYKVWYDLLSVERERLLAHGRTVGTGSAFLMRGWVPEQVAEQVKAECERIAPTCSVELSDPAEDEEPPVLLENNRVVAPYENIIEGFALPAYRSIDPTAVMAPFYACLFGMMLSDAGYGLVMMVGILALIRIKKPAKRNAKLLWVLFGSAGFTVAWGAIYNTWMGYQMPFGGLLDAMNDPMPVMVVCLGMGVIHLFAGLLVAAYMNIKRGKPWDALFDQFSWIMALTGLLLFVLGGVAGKVGLAMLIAGVALLLFFAGREKKNPIMRLIGGLSALYGVTSWLSDILSYMRLFGMGLATGVIGQVINMLVGMVFDMGPVGWVLGSLLFVFAHTFSLGINALGAYVHACRLQYIEFFGKFYEEGGVAFKPLSREITRYVHLKQA